MKLKLALLIIIARASNILAQDPHFSQWHSSKLTLNPSLAGANGCMNGDIVFRSQFKDGYSDTYSSFDMYSKKLHGGLGYHNYYSIIGGGGEQGAGGSSLLRSAISYAPFFRLHNDKVLLIPSIEFAFQEEKIDWTNSFPDVTMSSPPPYLKTKNSFLDISSGVLIVLKNFYSGFSVYHITKPDASFIIGTYAPLPSRLSFHAGYTFGGYDSIRDFSVTPGIIYIKQEDSNKILLSIKTSFRDFFSFSFAYRKDDAFIYGFELRLKWFRLGYSYDKTIPDPNIAITVAGTHEIHLGVSFKNKKASGLFIKNNGL